MILLYVFLLIALPVLDLIWLGGIAHTYYRTQLGDLLSQHPLWWAAGLFYVLYAAGILYFVVQPALTAHSIWRSILGGLFFGFVAYGTYDLTNLATTTDWPLLMSFVDMGWGAFAGAAVSGIAYLIATGILGL